MRPPAEPGLLFPSPVPAALLYFISHINSPLAPGGWGSGTLSNNGTYLLILIDICKTTTCLRPPSQSTGCLLGLWNVWCKTWDVLVTTYLIYFYCHHPPWYIIPAARRVKYCRCFQNNSGLVEKPKGLLCVRSGYFQFKTTKQQGFCVLAF